MGIAKTAAFENPTGAICRTVWPRTNRPRLSERIPFKAANSRDLLSADRGVRENKGWGIGGGGCHQKPRIAPRLQYVPLARNANQPGPVVDETETFDGCTDRWPSLYVVGLHGGARSLVAR